MNDNLQTAKKQQHRTMASYSYLFMWNQALSFLILSSCMVLSDDLRALSSIFWPSQWLDIRYGFDLIPKAGKKKGKEKGKKRKKKAQNLYKE